MNLSLWYALSAHKRKLAYFILSRNEALIVWHSDRSSWTCHDLTTPASYSHAILTGRVLLKGHPVEIATLFLRYAGHIWNRQGRSIIWRVSCKMYLAEAGYQAHRRESRHGATKPIKTIKSQQLGWYFNKEGEMYIKQGLMLEIRPGALQYVDFIITGKYTSAHLKRSWHQHASCRIDVDSRRLVPYFSTAKSFKLRGNVT